MSFFRSFGKREGEAAAAGDSSSSPGGGGGGGGGGPDTSPDQANEPARPPPATPPPPPPPVVNDDVNITVEDEPEEDPVRTELENQVRERDGNISVLEKTRLEKLNELKKLEEQLEAEQLSQMKEALIHKIEAERIKRQTTHAEDRLKALEHDMQDKAAIHEYANLIKGVAPKGGVDSQYVMKLQSQLQKAVKKMETTTEQMKELEESSQGIVDSLSQEISELVEERCRTELELRKQMDVLQEQKKEMQVEYEQRIQDNYKMLQALRAKAANQTTIEELEEELEETENRMEELHRIKDTHDKTIDQLTKSLAAAERM